MSDSLLDYILKKVERFPRTLFWESSLTARSTAEFQQLRELGLLRPVREDPEQLLYPCPSGRSCQGNGREIVKTNGQLWAVCTCPAEEPPLTLKREDVRRCAFNLDAFAGGLRKANDLKGTPGALDERLLALGESEFSGRQIAWVLALLPNPEDAVALLDVLPGRLPSTYDTILVITPSCAPAPLDAVRLEGRGIRVLAGVTDHALQVRLDEVLSPQVRQGAGLAEDLRGLVGALRNFLKSGETSEGYDPDALDWEAVEPAGNLHSAVCCVERHYPSKKLPAPKARNPWRCLLQTCRQEDDVFERQNESHKYAEQLLDWAEAELSRLFGLPHVDGTERSRPANVSGRARQRGKGLPAKRSWTQADLDEAIREYKAKRASNYGGLVDEVKRGKQGAKKSARQLFGRNAIVRALGVKSPAMVSNSTVWRQIADDLGLRGRAKKGRRPQGQRIGMEIALEEEAVASGDSAADEAIRRETIRLIEGAMPRKEAEATLEKLHRREITDDQARELVDVLAKQKQDDRARKIRQNL